MVSGFQVMEIQREDRNKNNRHSGLHLDKLDLG